jgi:hypothetical protein
MALARLCTVITNSLYNLCNALYSYLKVIIHYFIWSGMLLYTIEFVTALTVKIKTYIIDNGYPMKYATMVVQLHYYINRLLQLIFYFKLSFLLNRNTCNFKIKNVFMIIMILALIILLMPLGEGFI